MTALIMAATPCLAPVFAQPPCPVPDNGGGTVNLPPAGCGYVSPQDLHMIIDGLPVGTTINVGVEHQEFFNIISSPGGSLGGEIEQFQSFLGLTMLGTGLLSGFNRVVGIQAQAETHIGPRTPGDPVQSFDTDMFRLQGQLPPGDPDFDLLRITAGTGFGLPSPGHTTLTGTPGGNWNVDSFFDITYRIDFIGHSPGPLGGMSGSTTGTIRMQSGQPAPPPCTVVDDGSGTVSLPPAGCGYVSPADLHRMLDGLPPGTTVEIDAKHDRFFNVTRTPGGSLGGEHETFNSSLTLVLRGTGSQTGFFRTLVVPTSCQSDTAPRTPGDPIQSFDTDMQGIQGQLPPGDPDFDLLRITAGTGFGMPSPGHTTLTQMPGGNWAVDSFFDITYRIDFIGAPGGRLGGMSGSTTGTIRMGAGQPSAACPPIPAGTDAFPSTAMLVMEDLTQATTPRGIVRLSSAGMPDTLVSRQQQVGPTIQTEILSLELTGSHPLMGPISVHLNPLMSSMGQIQNVDMDPATCAFMSGDSFFDVFFDVELPALGETWTTNSPIHLTRQIHSIPPRDDPYENPFVDPVILFDQATGAPRARILYERHHVDPPFPPPGEDCFSTDLGLDVQIFGGPASHLQASGPTMVQRGGPYSTGRCTPSGSPCTTSADCPLGDTCDPAQTIDTEIVSMALTGFDPFLGPYTVRTSPAPPSVGRTQSQMPSASYHADSFFDVFVDIDVPAQGTLHNVQPVPLTAFTGPLPGLRNIPPDPGTAYRSPAGLSIPIADQGGQIVGAISNVDHSVGPPASWEPPPPPEEYCFDSWITLQITLYGPGCTETIMIPGDFRILRGGPTDPGDGRDLMQTLMANALFDGTSVCAGALRVALAPSMTSAGQIQSLAPAENFPADSFFDVFVEIDTAAGLLHTNDASHMATTINGVPPEPGEIYYGPGTVIPIYDATGVQVGEILEVSHEVHQRIVCPPIFIRRITMLNNTDFAVGGQGGGGGGGGLMADVARGDVTVMKVGGGNYSNAVCIMQNGPGTGSDPLMPAVGRAFYYVERDVFDTFQGSWNNEGPGQVGNRDATLIACP
jgi:hypothetical protein